MRKYLKHIIFEDLDAAKKAAEKEIEDFDAEIDKKHQTQAEKRKKNTEIEQASAIPEIEIEDIKNRLIQIFGKDKHSPELYKRFASKYDMTKDKNWGRLDDLIMLAKDQRGDGEMSVASDNFNNHLNTKDHPELLWITDEETYKFLSSPPRGSGKAGWLKTREPAMENLRRYIRQVLTEEDI
tara:strand:+ start:54 stop:599 length:546 start_codon:yes stop_codon:yes gene_type:complete